MSRVQASPMWKNNMSDVQASMLPPYLKDRRLYDGTMFLNDPDACSPAQAAAAATTGLCNQGKLTGAFAAALCRAEMVEKDPKLGAYSYQAAANTTLAEWIDNGIYMDDPRANVGEVICVAFDGKNYFSVAGGMGKVDVSKIGMAPFWFALWGMFRSKLQEFDATFKAYCETQEIDETTRQKLACKMAGTAFSRRKEMRKKIYKVTASVLTVSLCFALAGCSKEEAKSETVSSSANSVEPKATAEPAATPEPRKELTLTKLDVKEPNNIAVNGYLELPTVDGPYWQIVEDRLSSKNLEVYHKNGEENWTTAIFSGHTVYDYVADDGSLQKCIISGYEVFDLNNASDEIEYPNDTTQLRKEMTCERIYIYNNQDEYDAAVKNREEGQAILNGEEVAPERCVILNGSIVPNLQYEVGDDGKIRISMRDLANAYSSKTIYIEENHILYVPMVYQYTAKFPTKDTPQSVLDNLNISEVVNPDDDTFTYTSTISMDLWNDTFELPQDDTYMMPIEHISRILGWEFWTGDNVLKIVSDELDDTNPDNFVIDTTVREETCYDVGTGEEIACD